MSTPTPSSTVTEIAKAKPKLVIFDDDPLLLARFTGQYQELGYEVIPVMVASGFDSDEEKLFINGRLLQGEPKRELGLYEEPKHQDPVYDISNLLAEAQHAYKYNSTADRKETVDRYVAMSNIERGVKSKSEARALLAEIKPDFVLSDLTMREFADNRDDPEAQMLDDDTVLGTDIMRLAAETIPQSRRAIHSDGYTQYPHFNPNILEARRQKLQQARQIAEPLGYQVHPKDMPGEQATAQAIHSYFKQSAQEAGLPPR